MRQKTELEVFLDEPKNTHAREQILMHRFFLDVKTAAARRGYYLNTYFDDVDHDGFDVIFDDQDYIKKVQVKSVHKDGTTGGWEIHKRMLRPSFELLDKLGFESSPEGEGSEGGVVLIEFSDSSKELDANYYYTDVFVLLLFYHCAIRRKHKSSREAVEGIYREWRVGSGYDRISIPKAAFLKAKSADSLLSLMGLHSARQCAWKHHAMRLVSNTAGYEKMPLPENCSLEKMHELLLDELGSICDMEGLIKGTLSR